MQKEAIDKLTLQLTETIHKLEVIAVNLGKVIVPHNAFYTSKQVQQLLQISENTLQRMREEKRLIFFQIGNFSFRYPAQQFELYAHAA